MKTPFTHTNGKLEGTKIALMVAVLFICARIIAPLFGEFNEIDPSLAAGVLTALGGLYGGRQFTRTRYEVGGKNEDPNIDIPDNYPR